MTPNHAKTSPMVTHPSCLKQQIRKYKRRHACAFKKSKIHAQGTRVPSTTPKHTREGPRVPSRGVELQPCSALNRKYTREGPRVTSRGDRERDTTRQNPMWKCEFAKLDNNSKAKNTIQSKVKTQLRYISESLESKPIIESLMKTPIRYTSKSLESKNHYGIIGETAKSSCPQTFQTLQGTIESKVEIRIWPDRESGVKT